MITRPLDLASRLRPPPRNFDVLFWVNGAMLALFFGLFGSRFVLSPGLGVDFSLPAMPGALNGLASTPVVIAVKDAGFIMTEDGRLNLGQLGPWMKARVGGRTDLRLLVQADASLPLQDLSAILEMATAAGFISPQLAVEPPATTEGAAGRQP
ncbi:hypothetical protein MASR2M8_23380 [Opitutaceae bacterium]